MAHLIRLIKAGANQIKLLPWRRSRAGAKGRSRAPSPSCTFIRNTHRPAAFSRHFCPTSTIPPPPLCAHPHYPAKPASASSFCCRSCTLHSKRDRREWSLFSLGKSRLEKFTASSRILCIFFFLLRCNPTTAGSSADSVFLRPFSAPSFTHALMSLVRRLSCALASLSNMHTMRLPKLTIIRITGLRRRNKKLVFTTYASSKHRLSSSHTTQRAH